MRGLIIAVIILAVLILIALFLWLSNKAYFKFLRHDKPTSYFKDLRYRNVEGIIVGNGAVFKYLYPRRNQQKIYICTTHRRSLDMDFAALKTYFSHVKDGGTAYIYADYGDFKKYKDLRTPADFEIIHPHIFLERQEKPRKLRNKYPVIFFPGYTFSYLFMRTFKMMGMYKKDRALLSNVAYNEADIKEMGEILSNMASFCLERTLKPVILLMDNGDMRVNNELKERCVRSGEVEVKIIKRSSDFKEILFK